MFKKQHGFTAFESLLVVLILAVIGFGGYYIWHAQHSKKAVSTVSTGANKSTSSKIKSSSPAQIPNDELVITQWGVKLAFTDANKVTYAINNSTATLSLKDSVTTIPNCQDLQTALIRSTTGPASSSVRQVGNYYYHIAGDPAPCSDPNGENGSITLERNKILSELGNDNFVIEAN